MNVEEIAEAIRKLSDEDRIRLMKAVGPDLCDIMMSHPEAMAAVMPGCRGMMGRHPDMMARMQEMMSGMRGESPRPRDERHELVNLSIRAKAYINARHRRRCAAFVLLDSPWIVPHGEPGYGRWPRGFRVAATSRCDRPRVPHVLHADYPRSVGAVMGLPPPTSSQGAYPMTEVSWDDAQRFLARLSEVLARGVGPAANRSRMGIRMPRRIVRSLRERGR